jgi:hypothetical protein
VLTLTVFAVEKDSLYSFLVYSVRFSIKSVSYRLLGLLWRPSILGIKVVKLQPHSCSHGEVSLLMYRVLASTQNFSVYPNHACTCIDTSSKFPLYSIIPAYLIILKIVILCSESMLIVLVLFLVSDL